MSSQQARFHLRRYGTRRNKSFFSSLLVVLVISLASETLSAPFHPATEVIENLHGTLLSVMKDGERLGYRGRYEQLFPVVKSSFDLPFVAGTVMGRYWDELKADEKTRFIEEFSKLTIATYAANFDSYSRERFEMVSQKELSAGRMEIKTKLVKSDGEQVSLDYILRHLGNEWRIINIIANGVSDLALKRADYTSYLKSKGFDALLAKLREKTLEYSR